MANSTNIKSVFYIRQSAVISGKKQWRELQHIQWIKSAGYDVTLICSSFDHYKKEQRKNIDTVDINIHKIWSPGYRLNQSFMRVIDAWIFSVLLFFYLIRTIGKNDVLICSFPTPEAAFSTKLVSFFKCNKVVFDFRDAWPDALNKSNFLKKAFSFYVIILLKFIFIKQRKMCVLFMSYGMKNYYNKIFPLITNEFVIHNSIYCLDKTARKTNHNSPIVFVGNLNNQFSFDELLELDLYDDQLVDILIIGSGEKLEAIKQQFLNFERVKILGPLSYDDAMKKLASARATFFFYSNPHLFENHITNKVTEAINLRIPIITNLKQPSFDIWGDSYVVGVSTENVNIYDVFHKNFNFPKLSPKLKTVFSEDKVKKHFLDALFTTSPN